MPKKSHSVNLLTAKYVFNMQRNTESLYCDTVLEGDTQPYSFNLTTLLQLIFFMKTSQSFSEDFNDLDSVEVQNDNKVYFESARNMTQI